MAREVDNNSGTMPSLFQMGRIADERLDIARGAQNICRQALGNFDTLASAIHDLDRKTDEILERSKKRIEKSEENYKRVMDSENSVKRYEPIKDQTENNDHHLHKIKTKKEIKQTSIEKQKTICEKFISWIKSWFS
ncbi:MAG: hypothetical protein V4494_06060 [Chlamydiota bacterium]